MTNKVRVFWNPKSGTSGADGGQIRAMFEAQGCPCEITEVGPGLDVKALAAGESEDVAYVAAGGDGTVNAVADAVAGSGRAMGVLPVGTLNHFARDIGMPLDLEKSVGVIAAGHVSRVDAAEVNGAMFVNNSSLGFYPAMVVQRERMKKGGRGKWVSLVVASVKALAGFRHLRVEVKVDGSTRVCTTPFVFIGNNPYCMEGLEMGKRERVNAGVLSLYLISGVSRAGMMRLGVAALFGRLKKTPEYEELLVTELAVNVRGRRRLRVSMDGEVRKLKGPLCYRTRPGALRVIAPAEGTEEAK